ncbi:MAG: hypothetical protein AB1Z22_08130 [Synechococcaceae cyanobacterium]
MRHPALPIALLGTLLGTLLNAGMPNPATASARQARAGDADALQEHQQRLEQMFRQLDRNGDGRVDRDEARANPYLQRHFDRLDRGGKGFLVPADLR